MEKQFCHSFKLEQPIAEVFPLFSPEGETQWVPGWEFQALSGQTPLGEDDVFLTHHHDHAAAPAIWIIKQRDWENHRVQFYKIEPDHKVSVITVRCQPVDGDHTRVTVCYRYIGLSREGDAFIEAFSEAAFRQYIQEWQALLVAYFHSRAQ